jgi:hypothetical protein
MLQNGLVMRVLKNTRPWLPRRDREDTECLASGRRSRPGLTSLFDPEFTPSRRTDFTVDQRAGIRLLE